MSHENLQQTMDLSSTHGSKKEEEKNSIDACPRACVRFILFNTHLHKFCVVGGSGKPCLFLQNSPCCVNTRFSDWKFLIFNVAAEDHGAINPAFDTN